MSFRFGFAVALLTGACSVIAIGSGEKPTCCPPSQEVLHLDDKKQDDHAKHGDKHHDHDDHAGHDHGGGIFDVVKKQGTLNTLAAALGQAELEEVLSHDEWTLFAPTDEAFAQLPAEKLDFLLQPENKEKLKALLLAHVVEGAHASASATTEPKPIKSAQGAELQLSKAANGKMQISTASVVEADIVATNGVIHTIDAVIMPAGLID